MQSSGRLIMVCAALKPLMSRLMVTTDNPLRDGCLPLHCDPRRKYRVSSNILGMVVVGAFRLIGCYGRARVMFNWSWIHGGKAVCGAQGIPQILLQMGTIQNIPASLLVEF